VLVAVPTMLLAVALWLTTREPPRGLSEVRSVEETGGRHLPESPA
jgi:hypothetical protein